ncbi:MAG: hypothetical protein AB7U83_10310 [Vicinamibacterales bacterium]
MFVTSVQCSLVRLCRAALPAVLLVAVTSATAAAQPAAPVLQVQVSGQTVTAAWAPVAGATSYRAEAGLSPTQMLAGYELGPLTTFSINAPQGIYYLRVFARNAQGLSAASNVVGVTVSSTLAPPAPPTGLVATSSGSSVTFSVGLPAGPLTGLVVAAGVGPGQTQAVVPVPVASQVTLPNAPTGTFFARMHAIGPGGPSGASNEVQVTVAPSTCIPPAAPTVSATATGSTVSVSWGAVAGAAGYQLAAYVSPSGPPLHAQNLPASSTSVAYPGIPAGTYYVGVTAVNPCGGSAASALVPVVVTPPPEGSRTPNPPSPSPPNYLPLPNRWAVVQQMAQLYPNDLRNSCVEHGGNNIWLYRLVQRLRQEDTRWGLNWKRARVGDMSQDVIAYNFGQEGDEGTLNVHVVDVIGNHCGSNPGPAWIDQTVLWSTGAKWTLQPYSAAGFPR